MKNSSHLRSLRKYQIFRYAGYWEQIFMVVERRDYSSQCLVLHGQGKGDIVRIDATTSCVKMKITSRLGALEVRK